MRNLLKYQKKKNKKEKNKNLTKEKLDKKINYNYFNKD